LAEAGERVEEAEGEAEEAGKSLLLRLLKG
jgi:hypothetical protein